MNDEADQLERLARKNHMDRTVLPILAEAGEDSGVDGSGCLFALDDQLFLVSAAHVLLAVKRAPERVGIPVGPGTQEVHSLGVGQLGLTNEDGLDVAAFRFDDSVLIRKLRGGGFRILEPSDVSVDLSVDDDALSYEWPKEGARLQEETVHGAAVAMQLSVANLDDTFIDLEWPEAEDVPELQGISGCPIWRWRPAGPVWTPEQELELVGVQHTVKRGEFIRGTRWSHVHAVLRDLRL